MPPAAFPRPFNRQANVAIVAGDNSAAPPIDFIENPDLVRPGDRVISSGDGGVFPAGFADRSGRRRSRWATAGAACCGLRAPRIPARAAPLRHRERVSDTARIITPEGPIAARRGDRSMNDLSPNPPLADARCFLLLTLAILFFHLLPLGNHPAPLGWAGPAALLCPGLELAATRVCPCPVPCTGLPAGRPAAATPSGALGPAGTDRVREPQISRAILAGFQLCRRMDHRWV